MADCVGTHSIWSHAYLSSSNQAQRNYRAVISSGDVSPPGCVPAKVRVKFQAPGATNQGRITGASIGPRSGSTEDFASAPVRLTFGGSNSVSLPFGNTKWSDWADYVWDFGSDHLIHMAVIDSTQYASNIATTGVTVYRKDTSDDDTLVQDISGYATVSTFWYNIVDIEVAVPIDVWAAHGGWVGGGSQVYQNRQYRTQVKTPTLDGSTGRIRVRLKAHEFQDTIVTGASIGLRLSNDDFDGPPTRITFDSGNNGTTIPAGTEIFSDWVVFDLDVTKEYLFHYAGVGQPSFFYIYRWVQGGSEDPTPSYMSISGPDETMVESVSYSTDYSVASYLLMEIEGDPDYPLGGTTTTSTTTTTTTTDPLWIDVFGTDYFVCHANCSFDGDSYNESGPGISIKPTGSWKDGYRPKKIKVKGTGASSWGGMRVRDDIGGGNVIAQTNHTNSPQVADITFEGEDIERIDLPFAETTGIWFSADEFTTSTTTSTTTTTTTTTPFEEWDDIYYYRFTQAIANRLPDWTRGQADKYSVIQQFLNVAGKELEEQVESMKRALNSMFLRTMDMRAIDLTYQIELPYSFEFEYDFTDPTNPRPKPPDVWGIMNGNIYEISAVADNDINSFWYEPIGDRVSLGPDEETFASGDTSKLATGDVLAATEVNIGKLVATYNEPLIPGQLYVTISGLSKFGFKNDRIDVPGYVELKGVTVKDSEETERIPFSFDATLLTMKFWKEITDVIIYNIEPEDATITITSVAGAMQQIPDRSYTDYDTVGGRPSYWELEENNSQAVLQQLLPVSRVITDEPRTGFQLDVFREWLLVNANGFAIDYADVVDYTIERYRPYIYVLTSDGMLNIYNKIAEYPDLNSMRLLKNRTTGPKTVIYANYEEGIIGDQIKLSAKVLTKSKPVSFYYIQGAKPHHEGELQYISTAGVWGATIGESRVTMLTPTVNPPYKPYTITLEEGGCYTFVLTTRYIDGTEDKDVKIIWSRYKMPIASFDLMAADATLTTPRAICFDYNHRLWVGGSYGSDFKFKVLNLHADLMLIDYDKKLLYLREEYDRVWIGENDATTSTTTTTTTTTTAAALGDHFDDASIGGMWTVSTIVPGTVTEPAGTKIEIVAGTGTPNSADFSGVYTDYPAGDFDVTGVITDASGYGSGFFFGFGIAAVVAKAGGVGEWVEVSITADGTVGTNHHIASGGTGINDSYTTLPLFVRIVRIAGDFYSYFKEPGDPGWTALVPGTPLTGENGTLDIYLWALDGFGGAQTFKFDWFGDTEDLPDDWS